MDTMQGKVKRQWELEGLDCANCARKIEDKVKKIEGVSSCSVNFVTKTMTMETAAGYEESAIVEAKKTVKALEPHVNVREKTQGSRKLQNNGSHKHGEDHKHGHEHDHQAADGHKHDDADGHSHGHSHEHGEGDTRKILLRLGGGGILALAGIFLPVEGVVELLIFLAAYLIVGSEVVWQAVKNIIRGQVFDENFLMSLATIGAFAIGEYPEGVAVMLFYQIGELFQGLAVNRSRRSITALMDIRPEFAYLKLGNDLKRVSLRK